MWRVAGMEGGGGGEIGINFGGKDPKEKAQDRGAYVGLIGWA
jgi:hypothetical protein